MILTLALSVAMQTAPAPAPASAGAAPSASPASVVDNTVAKALVDEGRAAEAKKVVKGVRVPAGASGIKTSGPQTGDPAPDLKKAEELLAKNDGKGALAAFKRALAKKPNSAVPLWGMSRAADAAGDKANGKWYASLYVKSVHADKDPDVLRAAQWRAEQPDDVPPPSSTTNPAVPGSASPFGSNAIPTSAAPPATSTTTTTPPAPQPY